MIPTATPSDPLQLGYAPPPGGGGYGPPGGGGGGGGFGPPGGGGGFGPPGGGGFGPPGGGGYGPPGGGGFGPPGGGGYGPPGGGYGPPGGGYRPQPPRSGGGGGKFAIGCIGLFVLAGVGVGVLQYRAKQRISAFSKELDDSTAKLTKASEKITEERQQKGGMDKCVASVNERLGKIHAAKDDAPTAIPEGATLVCDTTTWQTSCSTPALFQNNTAFAASVACSDTASAETKALDDLVARKPYGGSSEVDAWVKDVDPAIAAHKTALAALKPPGVIAAMSSSCEATALESFVDNTSGTRRQLEANTCQVTMTWADATGNILGRLKATGHGSPPDSARKASTLSDSEMTDANAESERNGLDDGWAQLQKRIDVVNKKAGATLPKSSTPTPKTPPAKTTTPPPKTTTPPPKTTTPPPKKK